MTRIALGLALSLVVAGCAGSPLRARMDAGQSKEAYKQCLATFPGTASTSCAAELAAYQADLAMLGMTEPTMGAAALSAPLLAGQH